jgi:hypothetical protein
VGHIEKITYRKQWTVLCPTFWHVIDLKRFINSASECHPKNQRIDFVTEIPLCVSPIFVGSRKVGHILAGGERLRTIKGAHNSPPFSQINFRNKASSGLGLFGPTSPWHLMLPFTLFRIAKSPAR